MCAWVSSSLIDICSRTNPSMLSSAREEQYALVYFPNLHSLPMLPYPEDLRRVAGLYSEHKEQDYPPFLPHYSYSAPFGFKVTGDYSEHLTPHTCRFDIWNQQKVLWKHKQLYVQVLRPVDYTRTAFECVLNGRLLEHHIPRTVIVHRNYLAGFATRHSQSSCSRR